MKISNETKVGLLTALAIAIVIIGINFLKGKNIFSRNTTLYAKYDDIHGLSGSNPVMLHGLKVGQVDKFELINERNKNVQVKFHIDGGLRLPVDTKVKIVSSGLLGSMAMELVPGKSDALYTAGDTLQGYVEPSLTESISAVVAPVKAKVEKLLSSVDTVVTGLNEVMNDQTKRDLRSSFSYLKNTLHNVQSTSGRLDTLITSQGTRIRDIFVNIDEITKNVKSYNKAITHAINNISDLTDTVRALNLKKTIDQVNTAVGTVNSVLTDVQNGKGSLGKLMKDDKLYYNLQSASKNLDLLIRDIKIHPDRYLTISAIHIGRKYTPSPADTAK